ncbi:MAG: hypothetical protein KDI79_23985 [Anaerolineae bacterium]|nr:hypothetical protein [Anaerolineae bacterium]
MVVITLVLAGVAAAQGSNTHHYEFSSEPAGSYRLINGAAGVDTYSVSSLLTYTTYLPIVTKPTSLASFISETTISLPKPLADESANFCTWGHCSLSPRLYHEPLADGRTLLGWTDADGDGHISIISGSSLERTFNFPDKSVRGLVAHTGGSFAALLWDSGADIIRLAKFDQNGHQIWTTNLNSSIAVADFWLGDSRLAYGNGRYAAYHTVTGVSGGFTGHYGDQLKYVNDQGVIQSSGWDWGCSHSLAELVSYNADLQQFLPVCASDCYPDKGLILNHDKRIYKSDGNCGGMGSVQLGQLAPSASTWKLIFNALDRDCCQGRGIGLATINGAYQSNLVWLTNTNGAFERDPVIARLGVTSAPEQFLVGWRTTNDNTYRLGVIDGQGDFLFGPEAIGAGIKWGNRDDSFRTRSDGGVTWVQGDPLSTTLHLYRVKM